MSLRREPQSTKNEIWLVLIAVAVAAVAGVQLVSGTATFVWLLLACGALWALLVQASRTDEHAPARIRSSHDRTRLHRR